MTILAVYRAPFDLEPKIARLPEGLSLWELAAQMPGLPHDFSARGVICVNGKAVQRSAWRLITPKPAFRGIPVEVTFHAPPRGGEDTGKQVFALVASIALTALTGGILAGKFATAGGLFAKGSLSAAFLGAGASLAGSLLISSLSAPPIEAQRAKAAPNEGAASAQGNVLEANGAVPRVIGSRKVFPPLACEPLTYFDGPDEVVEAVYCLAGPHQITDVRIGAAAVTDMDVEFELREGWPGDDRLTLSRRQGRTDAVQTELRGHVVDADNGALLDVSTGGQLQSLPQPYVLATRDAPDVQWLHLAFAQGLHYQGSESLHLRVPLRIRIRQHGETDWINLPELHFQAANIRQIRATIALEWLDNATVAPAAATSEGFVEARRSCPGQTASPATDGWEADSYFGTSGASHMDASNLGSTGVEHVECSRYTARILLDKAVFPQDRYEVEIIRGAAFNAANYSGSGYTISGVVWDLFGYQGSPAAIANSRDGIADSLYLLRSVSVWNAHPVPTDRFALIALRARNRQLEQVSCVAGGWVRDWDGTAWRDWQITSNPAPHLRDIFAGDLNARPVPFDLLDEDDLLAWRADCTARGLTCNHLSEDQSVMDAASIVASCGYARPRMSDQWGVVRDYDRSGDGPVQIFTPRNSRGFSWTRAFPDLPDGFRVNFRDATRDYEQRQISVARPGHIGALRVTEQVNYEGIVSVADVTARAIYDLKQPQYRGTFYSLDAPAESIVCRRGSLVGVVHDMLTQWMGSGRVIDAEFDASGDITALVLDSAVSLINEPDMHAVTDMHAVADMHAVGKRSGAVIRGATGPQAPRLIAGATGVTDRIEFSTPIAADSVGPDDLVSVGTIGSEMLRLIVFAIEPRENLEASLTLVDEAQELHL